MKKTIFLKSITTGIFGLALLSNCSGAMEKKESHKCSSKETNSCSGKEMNSCSGKEMKEKNSCSSKKSK